MTLLILFYTKIYFFLFGHPFQFPLFFNGSLPFLAKKLNGEEDDAEAQTRNTDESEDEDPDTTDITSPLLLQAVSFYFLKRSLK